MSTVWIVVGSEGQYSDWTQWVVEAHEAEQSAKDRVGYLTAGMRELEANKPQWDQEDDTYDAYEFAEEGWREALKQLDDGASGYDSPRYSAYEVPLVSA